MTKVQPIPAGFHAITPYIIVTNAAEALEFYKKAFNAEERFRMASPEGVVMHAEIKIGDSMMMVADECPEMKIQSPTSLGGSPMIISLYVENVDSIFKQAIQAGATEVRPVQDQFYGDRSGTLVDPYGHMWNVATHIEDVSEEEIRARCEAMANHQHQDCC